MSGLSAAASVLLVVDLQERLVPVIRQHGDLLERAAILLRAARICGVPTVVTEHFPDKIGGTVGALRESCAGARVVVKTHFDACDEPGFAAMFATLGRRQAIICGIEAHVCVLQTALGLKGLGYDVYVATDACGSRRDSDRETGYRRLAMAGVIPVTSEMVVFEWAECGGTDRFRELLALIR
jgi:nicotinamidase-related amidase